MYTKGVICEKEESDDSVIIKIRVPGVNMKELDKNGTDIGIWLTDNRTITGLQRNKIYALCRAISKYSGHTVDEIKDEFKDMFIEEEGLERFSLSNCSLKTASDFMDFLIDFCFRENIPIEDASIVRDFNIHQFFKLCITYRKCCVCGKPADIHHVDTIGMGNNRRKVDDSKKRKMALCREHHSEFHTIGQREFEEKYHVYGIICNDEDAQGQTGSRK